MFKMIILLVVLLFVVGCKNASTTDIETRVSDLERRISSAEQKEISSDLAVLVAKESLSAYIQDFTKRKLKIVEGPDTWEIHFVSSCEECNDTDAYAVVDKSNGKLIGTFPYGKPMK